MGFDAKKRLVELAAGVYVTEDVLGVVERIQDYDPNLRVKFLDPDSPASIGDSPYKIVEVCPDGIERVVMNVWDLDERVLERLYAADTRKFDIIARLDRSNEEARRRERRFKEEAFGEAKEMAGTIIRSPKDTYTVPHPVDPKVTIKHSSLYPVKKVTRTGTEVKSSELME